MATAAITARPGFRAVLRKRSMHANQFRARDFAGGNAGKHSPMTRYVIASEMDQ